MPQPHASGGFPSEWVGQRAASSRIRAGARPGLLSVGLSLPLWPLPRAPWLPWHGRHLPAPAASPSHPGPCSGEHGERWAGGPAGTATTARLQRGHTPLWQASSLAALTPAASVHREIQSTAPFGSAARGRRPPPALPAPAPPSENASDPSGLGTLEVLLILLQTVVLGVFSGLFSQSSLTSNTSRKALPAIPAKEHTLSPMLPHTSVLNGACEDLNLFH